MLCVIKIKADTDSWHDLQTNSTWTKCPYEGYAIVPPEMVESIMKTDGYCNIELNEDKTEIISFTPTEKPVITEPEKPVTEKEQMRADIDYLAIMMGVEL